MALWVLGIAAFLVIYHHVGYPALLRWLAVRAAHKPNKVSQAGAGIPLHLHPLPTIALLIPVHNEQRVIKQKILNCAELRYPADRLTVTLALDGCTDGTYEAVCQALAQCPHLNVRVVTIEPNSGKLMVLNRIIPELDAEIVALSDASAMIDTDALQRAAAHFSDARVGVVCATYKMPPDASSGERAYWQYQVRIKMDEAAVAAPMGAHGALYLFRKALWRPLEPDTINDDWILPMRIVEAGSRAVYDQGIVATELEATDARQDFRRRIRIGAGNLQQTLRLWRLADPRRPGLAFVFVSGKALRSLMPFVLGAAAVASVTLALSGEAVWLLLLGMELALLLLALVPLAMPTSLPKPVSSLAYLAQGYLAAGVGSLLLLAGRSHSAWRISNTARELKKSTAGGS